jgi:hypothetical protein
MTTTGNENERLADRGYVERRTGRFGAGELRTYAYRLTETR